MLTLFPSGNLTWQTMQNKWDDKESTVLSRTDLVAQNASIDNLWSNFPGNLTPFQSSNSVKMSLGPNDQDGCYGWFT